MYTADNALGLNLTEDSDPEMSFGKVPLNLVADVSLSVALMKMCD